MFKLFFVAILMILTSGCGKQDTADSDPQLNPAVTQNFVKGVSAVVKEGTEYYGVGYFVAKPIKISKKGFVFKTYEAEVNIGAFGEDFIGNTMTASIEDDALSQQFRELDRNTLHIFKYEYPHKLNPEIEDTHIHIRSWEPLNANISFDSNGVESYAEKQGSYAEGVRQGKVVQVERWGYWDIDCSVTILMGGIKKDSGSTMENTLTMNTYSEESCSFAEKALKAGVDVSFLYSEDYVEFWDKHSRILHVITTLPPSEFANSME